MQTGWMRRGAGQDGRPVLLSSCFLQFPGHFAVVLSVLMWICLSRCVVSDMTDAQIRRSRLVGSVMSDVSDKCQFQIELQ